MRANAPLALLALAVLISANVESQTMLRSATTLAAVVRYPAFFHDKTVTVVGTPVELASGTLHGLPMETPKQFVIVPQSGRVPTRPVELRGRLYDLGRFASDDSRLGPLNLRSIVTTLRGDRWPAREQLLVLSSATWSDTNSRPGPTLRNLALQPELFEGQIVTISGRFRGRNLLGDLPAWPRQSEWDFVLQTADAAVWIVGKRPRGDGFNLSTTSRAQTGRWLEVTGRVMIADDLPLVVAERLRQADAEPEPEEIAKPVAAPLPPPEVIFSAPLSGDADVARGVIVRAQFSRPIQPGTLGPNITVRYADGAIEPPPVWSVNYRPGQIAVEIRFESPLAGGVELVVEFGAGVIGVDGVSLTPLTLRFTTSNRVE